MHTLLATLLVQLGEFTPPVRNAWTANVGTNDSALTTMETVISSAIGILTVMGGVFFVYTFVMGALGWITAGGESGKITKARDQMVQGAIGLIVLVGAYALVGLVGSVVGIDILNPAKALSPLIPKAPAAP